MSCMARHWVSFASIPRLITILDLRASRRRRLLLLLVMAATVTTTTTIFIDRKEDTVQLWWCCLQQQQQQQQTQWASRVSCVSAEGRRLVAIDVGQWQCFTRLMSVIVESNKCEWVEREREWERVIGLHDFNVEITLTKSIIWSSKPFVYCLQRAPPLVVWTLTPEWYSNSN